MANHQTSRIRCQRGFEHFKNFEQDAKDFAELSNDETEHALPGSGG